MTPSTSGSEAWMPNGFPPPSFVVETERTRTFGARGGWLAAAGLLGALLLIVGVLLIAGQDDDKTDLTAGSTTTGLGDSTSTTPTSTLEPTANSPTANTDSGDTNTTVARGTGTPAAGAAPAAGAPPAAGANPAPAGVLAVASNVSIPKFVSTGGAGSARVALKNNGNASLRFNSQTNSSALRVAPPEGTIAAGAEAVVTLTLNGAIVPEGPFSGTVSFGGTGGTQLVAVTSQVARLPVISESAQAVAQCPAENGTPPCSRLIDTLNEDAAANPCNSNWVFKVNVSDESNLKLVQALGPNIPLKTGNPLVPSGPSGVWQSDPLPKIPAGTTLTFTIEAVDQFDSGSRTNERRVTCPAAQAGRQAA